MDASPSADPVFLARQPSRALGLVRDSRRSLIDMHHTANGSTEVDASAIVAKRKDVHTVLFGNGT